MLALLDHGARESLVEISSKSLTKLATQPEDKNVLVDDTLLLWLILFSQRNKFFDESTSGWDVKLATYGEITDHNLFEIVLALFNGNTILKMAFDDPGYFPFILNVKVIYGLVWSDTCYVLFSCIRID